MTPSADIRLRSVLHGLRDVILPAIDPGNSLANEQAGLIVAQLSMLLEQLPWLDRYERLCRDDLRETALAVVDGLRGGETTIAAGAAVSAALRDPADDVHADYNRVGLAVEGLVQAVAGDAEPACRARVEQAVFGFGRRQVHRERVWFAASGFDTRPDELVDIATMIARAEHQDGPPGDTP